jgi:hypothetical protein
MAVLGIIAVCIFWLVPRGHPKLSVTYIQTIDGHGHWRLRFGITNVGDCTVFTSKFGKIELLNQTNLLSVGANCPLSKLAPGEGQVVDAVLSNAQMDSIDRKWRYSCQYAGGGLRPLIYHWQWGPSGPGARINWLIPQKLKGMPLTVKGTSDWIEPTKPRPGTKG